MLKIYNTLTRKKEEFKPIEDKKVRFYHCGPTVYWVQHIGNMRATVLADLINRSLRYLGYDVKLVRNYTDVGHLTSDEDEGEDKLEKGARRENKTPQEIAEKYIKVFEEDIRDLNVLEPEIKPRATEHIKEIIEMVKILLEKGYAYATDLAVYFDVSKAKDYTRLSRQILEKNISEAGKGEVSDKNKKHPEDFALWFFRAGKHKNALQFWESPFQSRLVKDGEGFPGWHIECSAMSKKYLGNTLDLHMGGIDHIPVHHTNEIAQSESANGVKFVNYWIHNEHLIAKSARISKSTGIETSDGEELPEYCVGTLKRKGYDPLALRYFFLNSHYRSKQNFTWEALEAAEISLNKLREKVIEFGNHLSDKEKLEIGNWKLGNNTSLNPPLSRGEIKRKFIEAIEDDFNMPQALAVMWEVVKSELTPKEKLDLIFDFDKILGLKLEEAEEEKIEIPEEVMELAGEREEARKAKDWKKADKLRDKITELGFSVEDTGKGGIIKKK
ncbi:MAG: cysteine--tRNA ligase [bacterium]